MARVSGEVRTIGRPVWAKDFGGREHIVPFPAKLDPSQFNDGKAVLVKANGSQSNGTNEQQTLTAANGSAGETFTLTFGGQTTAAIAYNATAQDVEGALEALSTVGDGNVKVTGAAGGPWTVEFQNALGNQGVAELTAGNFGGDLTVTPATTVPGVAGLTTLTVDAISAAIPAGTILNFGNGVYAEVTADAAAGATSITVRVLSGDIADNAEARYSRYGGKYIPSGILLGRTTAERLANTPFGLATDSDDEIYFMMFEVVNALEENDCELYRHGGLVAENHLPQESIDLLAANGALKTKVYALYTMIQAEA